MMEMIDFNQYAISYYEEIKDNIRIFQVILNVDEIIDYEIILGKSFNLTFFDDMEDRVAKVFEITPDEDGEWFRVVFADYVNKELMDTINNLLNLYDKEDSDED